MNGIVVEVPVRSAVVALAGRVSVVVLLGVGGASEVMRGGCVRSVVTIALDPALTSIVPSVLLSTHTPLVPNRRVAPWLSTLITPPVPRSPMVAVGVEI